MDVYEHCARTVRELDRDRYIADLFAPAAARKHLFALHAFSAEVARIRDTVSDPVLGEIRLQWWRDALIAGGGGHPVASALHRDHPHLRPAAGRLRGADRCAGVRPL